ncbi:MAG: hypothetical protein CM1200mP27_02680 [Chloroflexota bacterium]|nr:MAG: hypothetical protein CM1200mP27_02680 [Chloroflexota bacterium]
MRTAVTKLPMAASGISLVVFAVIEFKRSTSAISPIADELDFVEAATTPVKCRVRTGLIGTASMDLARLPSLVTPTRVPVLISEMEGDSPVQSYRCLGIHREDTIPDVVLRMILEGFTELTVPNSPDLGGSPIGYDRTYLGFGFAGNGRGNDLDYHWDRWFGKSIRWKTILQGLEYEMSIDAKRGIG